MSDETKNDLPVETEDMVDTGIDAAVDFALDPSIPAPIRKGLWAAAKRLGTALVEDAAGYFERRSTEKWAETNTRVKIIEEAGAQIREQIKVDPEFPQRASYTFSKQILREQFNREQVLGMTAGILKEKEYDDSTNQQTDNEAERTINEDWFNIFEKEASQKSSKDMQFRFAKVLAGEIEKPGSHSIKAVKALGDMDQTIANLFQKLCSVCIVLEVPFEKHIIDLRVPAIGGNPAQNSLQKYGLSFDQLNRLNEYGLIISDYNSYQDYKISIMDKNNKLGIPFRHQGQHWALKPSPERPERNEFRVNGVALSNVGRELFHIIDEIPMPQYAQDLKEHFNKQQLKMIKVVIEKVEQGMRYHIIQ